MCVTLTNHLPTQTIPVTPNHYIRSASAMWNSLPTTVLKILLLTVFTLRVKTYGDTAAAATTTTTTTTTRAYYYLLPTRTLVEAWVPGIYVTVNLRIQ